MLKNERFFEHKIQRLMSRGIYLFRKYESLKTFVLLCSRYRAAIGKIFYILNKNKKKLATWKRSPCNCVFVLTSAIGAFDASDCGVNICRSRKILGRKWEHSILST